MCQRCRIPRRVRWPLVGCPPDAANVLFQVVNQRYLRCRPMVFTTNKPLAAWADVLHDADLAEAIIDRVLARGRILELRGPSYRTRHIKPPHLPPEVRAGVSGKVVPEFPEPTNTAWKPTSSGLLPSVNAPRPTTSR
jgi:hypothetical protein